jgi:hypothetical protein
MIKRLLVLILFSNICVAQQKGDNTIILPKVPIDTVFKVLAKNGYAIVTSNEFQVITDLNPMKRNSSIKIKLVFYFADNHIELSGKTNDIITASLKGHNNSDLELMLIENRGSKKSWMREVWDEMNRIATEISSSVHYLKK